MFDINQYPELKTLLTFLEKRGFVERFNGSEGFGLRKEGANETSVTFNVYRDIVWIGVYANCYEAWCPAVVNDFINSSGTMVTNMLAFSKESINDRVRRAVFIEILELDEE
jgi:hypothetical protein